MTIKLGCEVRDKVTGFRGIATGRAEYITGCTQFCVVPKMKKDGKAPDACWYDDKRLEVVGKGISVESAETGGPMAEAPSSH